MFNHIKTYWKQLLGIIIFLSIFGFITYTFVAPHGLLSGVQNDLKSIEPPVESPYITLEGQPIELSMYKGKPLVINSWATWAPFAQTEFPILNAAKEKYSDQIEIISINRKENINIVKSYLNRFKLGTDIIILIDPTDYFYRSVEGYAMPETVFYDSEGIVKGHKRGVLNQTELEANIAKIIE